MLEEKMLEKKTWAVVGANTDPEKYGNMIYRKLKSRGYRVYAVNPVYKEIDGDECYSNLSSLPEKPDVVNLVVTPKRSLLYAMEAKELGIEYLWFQPGTFDDLVMNKVNELGLHAVQACALVATR
ncbi:MAG: CoA-binding protein [Clostridia bacterium]|nr:CoA-binding protein [Clostridia bacterium]